MRRIIDMHIHAYDNDRPSAYFGADFTNPLTGDLLVAATDADEHRAKTLAAFDELGVVQAMVSPGSAEGVARFKQADPERVLCGFSPYVAGLGFDSAAARAAHQAGRLDVIGEVTAQYHGIGPDHPSLEPAYALAEELDVPVAYHMFPGGPPGRGATRGGARMRGAHGNPLLLEDVLQGHPRMRLYVMHAGWPMLSEMLALLYAYPQVNVDVGVIAWSQPRAEFHEYLRRLVQAGYTDRVMFGSDQMVWPEAISMSVAAVEDAAFLTEHQKQAIFHDNAAAFLRL